MRIAIGTYYAHVIGATDRKFWGGKDGVIAKICEVWNLNRQQRRKVRRILESVHECRFRNTDYDGRSKRKYNKGRTILILPGSVEEGLIADWMEAGLGFRHTTTMVNQHRREEGLRIVGRSCVMSTFDRMNPILTNIAKCCQGNSNNEGWRTARYNQTKQMMVMTGHITKEELEKEYGIDKIPLHYHPDHLPKITPKQLVWFDETHIQ